MTIDKTPPTDTSSETADPPSGGETETVTSLQDEQNQPGGDNPFNPHSNGQGNGRGKVGRYFQSVSQIPGFFPTIAAVASGIVVWLLTSVLYEQARLSTLETFLEPIVDSRLDAQRALIDANEARAVTDEIDKIRDDVNASQSEAKKAKDEIFQILDSIKAVDVVATLDAQLEEIKGAVVEAAKADAQQRLSEISPIVKIFGVTNTTQDIVRNLDGDWDYCALHTSGSPHASQACTCSVEKIRPTESKWRLKVNLDQRVYGKCNCGPICYRLSNIR